MSRGVLPSFQTKSFKQTSFLQDSFTDQSFLSSNSFERPASCTELARQSLHNSSFSERTALTPELEQLQRLLKTTELSQLRLELRTPRFLLWRSIPRWKVAFEGTFQRGSAKEKLLPSTLTDANLGHTSCMAQVQELAAQKGSLPRSLAVSLFLLLLVCIFSHIASSVDALLLGSSLPVFFLSVCQPLVYLSPSICLGSTSTCIHKSSTITWEKFLTQRNL